LNGKLKLKKQAAELELQIRKIKDNKEWFSHVKNEAKKTGLSIDSMLV
jgi:hypothetical protein